jgi:N-acetylglutamate synthase-like GNAT family acetyltransferase
MEIRKFKLKDAAQIIEMLHNQWNLARIQSNAHGNICARIYFCEILSTSDEIWVCADGKEILGAVGFGGFEKIGYKRKYYARKMRRLMKSKLIENKSAIFEYYDIYNNFAPVELWNEFDCELSIIIVKKDCQKHGVGTALFDKICIQAKTAGMKKLRIDTDDYTTEAYPTGNQPRLFYEKCGCVQVFKTPNKKSESENLYVYKKDLV